MNPTTLFLLQIIGPSIMLLSISMVFHAAAIKKMIQEMVANTNILFIWGILTFVVGLVMVIRHNLWMGGWEILVSLFGWAALIK